MTGLSTSFLKKTTQFWNKAKPDKNRTCKHTRD